MRLRHRGPMLVLIPLLAAALGIANAAARPSAETIGPNATRWHRVYVGIDDNWLAVRGNGATNLDCWVYDDDSNEVDSDTKTTDACLLRTPGIGRHRLKITNLGASSNQYTIKQTDSLDESSPFPTDTAR